MEILAVVKLNGTPIAAAETSLNLLEIGVSSYSRRSKSGRFGSQI